jgi:hypothetical protein
MHTYKNYPIDEYYKIKPDVEYILDLMYKDKLNLNYTKENFYKDNPLFVSIIYKYNQPFEASTVITRNTFNGGCRVLNRLMVNPSWREKGTAVGIPETTLTMLQSQINYAKENFNFAFISREFNTYRFCKRFAKDASAFLGDKWDYETDRFLVCNDTSKNSPCWQNIAWTKFTDLDTFPLQAQSSSH